MSNINIDRMRVLSTEIGQLSQELEDKIAEWRRLVDSCSVCGHALAVHRFPNGELGGICYEMCACKGFDGSTGVR